MIRYDQAGDIAKFQCEPGFRLKGGPISHCQQVGCRLFDNFDEDHGDDNASWQAGCLYFMSDDNDVDDVFNSGDNFDSGVWCP